MRAILSAALLVSSFNLFAGTVTVTSPTGLLTATSGGYISDPFSKGVWYRAVEPPASSGITTDFPNAGNGSAYLSTSGSAGFAQMNYYLTTPAPLSSLTALSYSWIRSASSTSPVWEVPDLILYIDPDGTGTHNGSLIYQVPVSPTGAWQTSDSLPGEFVWFEFNNSVDFGNPRTLSQWESGAHDAGYTPLSGSSLIDGFDLQAGPGASGTFIGAADLLTYQFGSAASVTVNFEAATVPEPATLLLAGASLLAFALRRRYM